MEMNIDCAFHPEKIDPSAFVAPSAVVVGDVTVGAEASLWFGAVVRGDMEAIVIGAQTSVQDGCVIHADAGEPCRIGERVTVGHCAIVHGAIVEDDVLIGMRATVLNGARIGSGSIIAAGALVTPGTVIPPGSLVMGMPGKVVRLTTEADAALIRSSAEHYFAATRAYRKGFPQ
jgi:carbonic anhydrase/acetyltransferase-like protein (isoleucine patch superfamily)